LGSIGKRPSAAHSPTLPLRTVIRLGLWCLILEVALILFVWLLYWAAMLTWAFVAGSALGAYAHASFSGNYGLKRSALGALNLICLLALTGLSIWTLSLLVSL